MHAIGISLGFGKHGNIFQAEILAFLACTNMGLEKGYANSDLVKLDSVETNSRIVWEHLLTKLSYNTIQIRWVPGH